MFGAEKRAESAFLALSGGFEVCCRHYPLFLHTASCHPISQYQLVCEVFRLLRVASSLGLGLGFWWVEILPQHKKGHLR